MFKQSRQFWTKVDLKINILFELITYFYYKLNYIINIVNYSLVRLLSNVRRD